MLLLVDKKTIMPEEPIEDKVSTKYSGYLPNIVKDIVLGACVFVGMNLQLLLVGHILGNLFSTINHRFFDGSPYDVGMFEMVKLATIFFINVVLFIVLLVKRPRMMIGAAAGIPVLMATLVLIWFALCIFVVVAWFALLFLNEILT
jgi:hypothetical protein